ncbi:MAG: hypothetical protein FWD77_03740 [Betaproteobacteria bacterium]|nr:hypothetical protein [Betaproteobacteria bacterium]
MWKKMIIGAVLAITVCVAPVASASCPSQSDYPNRAAYLWDKDNHKECVHQSDSPNRAAYLWDSDKNKNVHQSDAPNRAAYLWDKDNKKRAADHKK